LILIGQGLLAMRRRASTWAGSSKQDHEGNLIGRSNQNPLLDTSIYEVEFDDAKVEEYYTANLVAKSIYSRLDKDGYTVHTVDEIMDGHKHPDAYDLDDSYVF
jgi:hypothetical protein